MPSRAAATPTRRPPQLTWICWAVSNISPVTASSRAASKRAVTLSEGEWITAQELNDVGEQALPVAGTQTARFGDRQRGPRAPRTGEMQGPHPQDPPQGSTGALASQIGTEGGSIVLRLVGES